MLAALLRVLHRKRQPEFSCRYGAAHGGAEQAPAEPHRSAQRAACRSAKQKAVAAAALLPARHAALRSQPVRQRQLFRHVLQRQRVCYGAREPLRRSAMERQFIGRKQVAAASTWHGVHFSMPEPRQEQGRDQTQEGAGGRHMCKVEEEAEVQ